MRLVVLGSGTCVPSANRSSSGYWLEALTARLRLDSGAGTVHAMARAQLPWETLTHQLISHFHIDHTGDLAALLFAFRHGRSAPREAPLTLAGPVGLRDVLERLRDALYPGLLTQDFPLEILELPCDGRVDLGGGVELRLAKTPHTGESVALRIDAGSRSLGYTGDTAYAPELAAFFRGVDVLLAECSFIDAAARGTTCHLTADELATLARDASAGHLVATHMYFDPDAARLTDRLSRVYPGRVTVAHDGLALDW